MSTTLTLAALLAADAPPIRVVAAPWPLPDDTTAVRYAVARLEPRDLLAPAVLHAELADAWSLPDYYGRNWDALCDVLSDAATFDALDARLLVIDELDVALALAPVVVDLLVVIVQDAERALHESGKRVRLVLVGPAAD